MPAEGPGRWRTGLVGCFEELVGLDDRLGEFGHGDAPVLALALQQAEGFAFAELPSRHEYSLGAFDQLSLAQGRFELVDVFLEDFELTSAGDGNLNGCVQTGVRGRFEEV